MEATTRYYLGPNNSTDDAVVNASTTTATTAASWGVETTTSAPPLQESSTSEDYVDQVLSRYGEEPIYAVIFPFTCLSLGVVVFFLLKRWKINFPYAACMFILGICMGSGVTFARRTDHLSVSILQWSKIDPEVLLGVFVPGLLFKEALEVNINLFTMAFWQILILAYPMVLVGTILVACIVHYIFPFGWSFNVSMALAAVLSSTDPAAVANILKEAGAPPRLKMHISGESLLNDGSSYVFFIIFSTLAYAEMGLHIEGLPEEVSVVQGFIFFCREALGGAVVGVVCALFLVGVLHELERRLEREYDILQVVATLCGAYLTYYIADVPAKTSGIVACSTAGIVTNALGKGLVNDEELLDTYLALLDHSLNTVLFALGGVIWGVLVASPRTGEEGGTPDMINRTEWGFLIVLYGLGLVARYIQVGVFYPVFSRIGLASNWRECVFLAFIGIRGAISIALALFFYRLVFQNSDDREDLDLASGFMFMAGGVSLLSLIIKGAFGGPLLRALKLSAPSTGRVQALQVFDRSAEELVRTEYIRLLSQPRFEKVDNAIVEAHVPFLSGETMRAEEGNIRSARGRATASSVAASATSVASYHDPSQTLRSLASSDAVIQMRQLFLQLLADAYEKMVKKGELLTKEQGGILADVLRQSVAFAFSASKDGPLNDWHFACLFHGRMADAKDYLFFRRSTVTLHRRRRSSVGNDAHYREQRSLVLRSVSLIDGHDAAEAKLRRYVSVAAPELRESGSWEVAEAALETVLEESRAESAKAREMLEGVPAHALSHYVAVILIQQLINYVESQAKEGVLKPEEAHKYLDHLDKEWARSLACRDNICEKVTPIAHHGGVIDENGSGEKKKDHPRGRVDDEDGTEATKLIS